MSNVVASWRAAYTPGNWTVLAGPTALVAIDPDAGDLGEAVDRLWDDVLASASITELVGRLAVLDVRRVPKLAVVFWDANGLRTLIRGAIAVRDAASGATVADGADVITWREVGLGQLRTVELQLAEESPGTERALPLVVGVVRAGRLRLDAAPDAAVTSPQATESAAESAAESPTGPTPDAVDTEPELPVTAELGPVELDSPTARADDAARREMESGDTQLLDVAAEEAARPTVLAALCVQGHPNPPYASGCWICGAEVPAQSPQSVPRPVLGKLRVPDGSTLELDRPVLIGRAPSAAGFTGEEPRLLTVPSPSHDISRTHVLVAPEGWQILVTDLHSTNGTTVVNPGPGVDRVALQPGQPLSVAVGTLVELGDGVAVLIDAAQ